MARRRVAGVHAAESAVEHSPERIVTAWIDPRRRDPRLAAIAQKLEALGVWVQSAAQQRLDELAEGGRHQGVVLELAASGERSEQDLQEALGSPGEWPLFLVLDQVQDPHNLGACLRTAAAAGAQGVVVTRDRSVGLTSTVARVASGAAEIVPVYRVVNLARVLRWFRDSGLWVVGTAAEAEQSLYAADLTGPLAIVVGAEGKGLRRLTRDSCDLLVKIPLAGGVESLNLSVAAGVVLFEAVRQRGARRAQGRAVAG